MPIHTYKCSSCGYDEDEIQRVTDAPLTRCPKCGEETYAKQVSAPPFSLKGNGWYATDFKNKGDS